MKRKILSWALMFIFLINSTSLLSHDFEAIYNGKTIYYNIISPTEVEVTFMGEYYNSGVYFGDMAIPSQVVNNGITYDVTAIGEHGFRNSGGLTSLYIPKSITKIGDDAFWNCFSLTYLDIPNSVNEIGEWVFYQCKNLRYVNLPDNITEIKDHTFHLCKKLTFVEIPSLVESIGICAFYTCSSIETIYIRPETAPSLDFTTFLGVDSNTAVYIACGSLNQYIGVDYWNRFLNYQEVESLTYFEDTICYGDIYTNHGFNATETGIHIESHITDSGCDSVFYLNLFAKEPIATKLDYVTVNQDNNNVIYWKKDEEVLHYNIYLEEEDEERTLIASIPYDSQPYFIDVDSSPDVKAHTYSVTNVDTCMNESPSNPHTTIHLRLEDLGENGRRLRWSHYKGMQYYGYKIYRGIGSLDSLEHIADSPLHTYLYTDAFMSSEDLYYQIEIEIYSNKSIRSNYVSTKLISIDDISVQESNSITLYPNPTNNEVSISSESLINSIEIYNSLGQKVYTETINSKEKTIDISSLPSGVYVLGAKTDDGIMRKKIIKN